MLSVPDICPRQLNCISITKRSGGQTLDHLLARQRCCVSHGHSSHHRQESLFSLLRKVAWECAEINCRVSVVHVAESINIIADTVSHLHEGKVSILVQICPSTMEADSRWLIGTSTSLSQCCPFYLCECSSAKPESRTGHSTMQNISQPVQGKTYKTHLRSYSAFCGVTDTVPVPAFEKTKA